MFEKIMGIIKSNKSWFRQLSYDIVKAHGGVPIAIGMKVETKEGEGTAFTIILPITIS